MDFSAISKVAQNPASCWKNRKMFTMMTDREGVCVCVCELICFCYTHKHTDTLLSFYFCPASTRVR